jgi:hypothetical protein
LPSLGALSGELAPRGFTALFVDIGEDMTTVAEAVKERGYPVPVLLDTEMKTARAYGVRAAPTVVLVGRDGRILATSVGPRSWTGRERRALLEHLLDKEAAR